MKKWKQLLYCILFFGICLCPSLGMLFAKQETSSENRKLAEFPSLKTEEGWNVDWLSQAGEYFQDHFAFRNELVTANALLNGKVLGVSTASGVIQGTDGWLYYKDSLSDYLGDDLLSDRSLFNIAHTLSMMQKYLEDKGVNFLFTVAPNKNSLYSENMPYYDSLKVSEDKNLVNLKGFLESEGVAYANLYDTFLAKDEVLYHKRDSHWNNKGAALASDTLLAALGKEYTPYEGEAYEVRTDFEGDLDQMLYPMAMEAEDEIYFERPDTFAYVGEVESNFDPKITTVNPSKTGSLVMYRDSFGNALLPFMANEFAAAYFSRGIPYQLSDVDTMLADTVVVERAERFLPEMAQSPPVMTAFPVQWTGEITEKAVDGAADIQIKPMGPVTQLTGRILDGYLDTESQIYIRLNNADMYEAFPMDMKLAEGADENGFCLYAAAERLPAGENTLEVLVREGDTLNVVYQNMIKEETNNEEQGN